MKPRGRKVTNPLADFALDILEEAMEPLHIKALVEKMLASGWTHNYAKPLHVVYTTLHGLIQRQGEACVFRLVAPSTFATRAQVEESDLEVRAIVRQRPKYSAPLIAEEHRRCGNCNHIRFHALQEITQREGTCGKYQESGIISITASRKACPLWEAMTLEHKERLRKEAINLSSTIAGFNISVRRVKMSPREFK